VTKVRAWKGVGQKCNPRVTFTLPGMQMSVREWTHTLQSGFPLWELKSLWNFEFSKSNLKGQNSLDWKLLYTIGKPLICRCLKWAHMIHLIIYNTSYFLKKGMESKCQFDSRPLKVKNHPELHVCRRCATYFWKTLDKGYNFALKLTSIEGLHTKLLVSKLMGVLILGISRLPTWES